MLHREIFSVTKTACPQGGGKLLRSRRFLQGTPCAETGFSKDWNFLLVSLEISSAKAHFLVFLNIKKQRESCEIFLAKRRLLDLFLANKALDR